MTSHGGCVTIDLKQLAKNYQVVKSYLPKGTKRMAVLKGNGKKDYEMTLTLHIEKILFPANEELLLYSNNPITHKSKHSYGHGLAQCAQVAVKEGLDYIGVVDNWEVEVLRRQFPADKFGCLGIARVRPATPSEMESCISQEKNQLELEELIGTFEHAKLYNSLAEKAGRKLFAVLKLDVGIGRMAFHRRNIKDAVDALKMPMIQYRTIACHFPSADDRDFEITQKQLDYFCDFVTEIKNLMPPSWETPTLSFSNSAFTFRHPEKTANSMIRMGMGQFGSTSDRQYAPMFKEMAPVLSFKGQIVALRRLEKDDTVSYGMTWAASRPSLIATVGAGYSNGIKRGQKNPSVLVNGEFCSIVGKICMNVVMVDVTHLKKEPCLGDDVVFIGKQGERAITADDVADRIEGGLSYEVTIIFGSNSNNKVHFVQ